MAKEQVFISELVSDKQEENLWLLFFIEDLVSICARSL